MYRVAEIRHFSVGHRRDHAVVADTAVADYTLHQYPTIAGHTGRGRIGADMTCAERLRTRVERTAHEVHVE